MLCTVYQDGTAAAGGGGDQDKPPGTGSTGQLANKKKYFKNWANPLSVSYPDLNWISIQPLSGSESFLRIRIRIHTVKKGKKESNE